MDGYVRELGLLSAALFGGVARAVNVVLNDRNKTVSFLRIVLRGFVGCFSGWLFAKFCHQWKPDWDIPAAGMGGWLGADGIDFAIDYLRRKFAPEEEPTTTIIITEEHKPKPRP